MSPPGPLPWLPGLGAARGRRGLDAQHRAGGTATATGLMGELGISWPSLYGGCGGKRQGVHRSWSGEPWEALGQGWKPRTSGLGWGAEH